jgi:hypothetical protein
MLGGQFRSALVALHDLASHNFIEKTTPQPVVASARIAASRHRGSDRSLRTDIALDNIAPHVVLVSLSSGRPSATQRGFHWPDVSPRIPSKRPMWAVQFSQRCQRHCLPHQHVHTVPSPIRPNSLFHQPGGAQNVGVVPPPTSRDTCSLRVGTSASER